MNSSSSPVASKKATDAKTTALSCGCLVIVAVLIYAFVSGAFGKSAPVPTAKKRTELKTFVSSINSNLQLCDSQLQNATAEFVMVAQGHLDELTAYNAAKEVTSYCSMMDSSKILDIGSLSVPDGLSGYNLSQVQSDMEIWSDTDAVQAGKDMEALLQNPNDLHAASDFQSQKADMESQLSDANSILASCAKKIGLSPVPTVTVQGLG